MDIRTIIRRISLDLEALDRKIQRFVGTQSPPAASSLERFEATIKARELHINKTTLMRGALMMLGGRASYKQWVASAKEIDDVTSKMLSSIPSKLLQRNEVVRVGRIGGSPAYEMLDWLNWFSLVKEEPTVYEAVRNKFVQSEKILRMAVPKMILSFAKKNPTYLIEDFLKVYWNVCDQEIRSLIEEALPSALSELSAKGMVELTEGLGGILIGNKSISRVSIREGLEWPKKT
jgi:hypothetical protein